MKSTTEEKLGIGCVFASIVLGITSIAGFFTHLFWIFETFMSEAGITFGQFVLAAIGVFLPPIGILHGIYLWFV